MPITFGYLIKDYEFIFRTHDEKDMIIYANDGVQFIRDLQKYGYYESYVNQELKKIDGSIQESTSGQMELKL